VTFRFRGSPGRIAKVLDVPIFSLFQQDTAAAVSVVRKQRRMRVSSPKAPAFGLVRPLGWYRRRGAPYWRYGGLDTRFAIAPHCFMYSKFIHVHEKVPTVTSVT